MFVKKIIATEDDLKILNSLVYEYLAYYAYLNKFIFKYESSLTMCRYLGYKEVNQNIIKKIAKKLGIEDQFNEAIQTYEHPSQIKIEKFDVSENAYNVLMNTVKSYVTSLFRDITLCSKFLYSISKICIQLGIWENIMKDVEDCAILPSTREKYRIAMEVSAI